MVDVTNVRRKSGGSFVTALTVKRRVSGAWVTVWTNFSVEAWPNPVYGNSFNGSGVPASGLTSIDVTGGVGPFTYSLSGLSGGTGITLTNPNTNTPGFQTSSDAVQYRTGTYRMTVTDTGNGGATVFVDISVELSVE